MKHQFSSALVASAFATSGTTQRPPRPQPLGGGGPRIACGVITVNPL